MGEHREKKFVTFEKINSFKRGGVRYCVGGGCYDNDFGCGFEGSGRRFIFSKVKISFSEWGGTFYSRGEHFVREGDVFFEGGNL